MKVTIVHADVKVEYSDDRIIQENTQYITISELNHNIDSIIRVIDSLGSLVNVIKHETKKENG